LQVDVRPALKRMMIASIGPTTSEALLEFDIPSDMTPSHPKMGFLIKEASEQSHAILEGKRGG
jgi:uroporphyrinogen-III synthase